MSKRLVFGRTEYAEPLTERGETEAEADDVTGAFPGEWVELVAFPVDALRWIVQDGREVEYEQRSSVRSRD
jgi:hypothetical protein